LQVGFSRAGEQYKTTLRHSAYIIIDTRIATADGRWPIEPVIDRSRPSIAGGIRRTHACPCVRACVRACARFSAPSITGSRWPFMAASRRDARLSKRVSSDRTIVGDSPRD